MLRRISDLLYIQGYTIKGVQRLLREGGGKLSDDIPPATDAERAAAAAERAGQPEQASLLPMEAAPSTAAAFADITGLQEENLRLRILLQHALEELEAIRDLLP